MSKKPTIYEIAELTKPNEKYFFSKATLKFFGQSMSKFYVHSENKGKFKISCPIRDHSKEVKGETVRYFNPVTNRLDFLEGNEAIKIPINTNNN